MNKLFSLILSFIFIFVFANATFAQSSPEEVAQKYRVSFPVSELGNCANINECRSYCEDPLHQNECIEFAKQKGFYKENKTAIKNALINVAKKELGCETEDACREFCGEQKNWEKCGEFAKKHKLSGGKGEDTGKKEILTKAKEVLGCNSTSECKGFCEKEENKQKCDEFAKLIGLKGGIEKKGPGGCTSLETCKAFCSEPQNFQICEGFAKSRGDNFKGPGGCSSEDSCRSYCKEHAQECLKYYKGMSKPPVGGIYEICSRTPNCRWAEDRCECKAREYMGPQGLPAFENADEMARFCREFPEKCKNATSSGVITPEQYCKTYPDRCLKSPYPTYTPKPTSSPNMTYCQKPAEGCGEYHYWDSTKCICRSYEEYCKLKGCTWTNNTCQCSTSNYTPYPSSSPITSGNTGTSSSVQGVSTAKGLIQQFLDWLSP